MVELRRLASTHGPLWLVAPLALSGLRFARRGLLLVALCAASMTFAYDWGRIIFLAAPVFYVAGGWAVRHRRRLALATVLALFALDLYAIYMQVYSVAHGIDTSVSHRVPVDSSRRRVDLASRGATISGAASPRTRSIARAGALLAPKPRDHRGERHRIARGDQPLIGQESWQRPDPRARHRQACRHRLGGRESERLERPARAAAPPRPGRCS